MGKNKSWLCTVCGYVHEGGEAPECCPVCGATRDLFEAFVTDQEAVTPEKTTSWRCLNCDYVAEGDAPPELCPVCGAAADKFEALVVAEDKTSSSKVTHHVVIIGAGVSGVSAAEAARKTSPGSKITLISREAHLPYYRLNLTRFLAGEIEQEKLLIHPEAWYQENQIDLYLDAEIQAINRDERRLKLKNDRDLEYDRLILALGAHPFVPPIPGSNRENIMTLRTRTDAENILKKVQDGLNCVVVGGGVLGLETAAALARLGCNVTAMEGFDWLLPRQLNRAAGEKLCAFVEALGIKVITGARIKQFDGDERVCSVVLATEESFDSDLVLIAAGVRSNTYLARLAGLEVNDGVVVNNSLQTSDPDIFAVGDVSEHQGVSYGTWAPAQFQGSIAGMNASGDSVSFAGIPRSNMLKVLGVELFSIGNVHPDDASYQTYELDEKGRYAYFVFRDTHLIGAILLGDTALSAYLKQLIESQLSCAEILSKSKSAKELYDALLQRS